MAQCAGLEPLLTVEQLAAYLSKHPEQIRRMARGGTIPAMKAGETWRFERGEIERWLRGEVPTEDSETD